MKKGSLAKSEENELLIVDESKKPYKVDQAVVAIWNMCDGNRTDEQIVDDLAKETKAERSKLSEAVLGILTKLEQVGLIQKVV